MILLQFWCKVLVLECAIGASVFGGRRGYFYLSFHVAPKT